MSIDHSHIKVSEVKDTPSSQYKSSIVKGRITFTLVPNIQIFPAIAIHEISNHQITLQRIDIPSKNQIIFEQNDYSDVYKELEAELNGTLPNGSENNPVLQRRETAKSCPVHSMNSYIPNPNTTQRMSQIVSSQPTPYVPDVQYNPIYNTSLPPYQTHIGYNPSQASNVLYYSSLSQENDSSRDTTPGLSSVPPNELRSSSSSNQFHTSPLPFPPISYNNPPHSTTPPYSVNDTITNPLSYYPPTPSMSQQYPYNTYVYTYIDPSSTSHFQPSSVPYSIPTETIPSESSNTVSQQPHPISSRRPPVPSVFIPHSIIASMERPVSYDASLSTTQHSVLSQNLPPTFTYTSELNHHLTPSPLATSTTPPEHHPEQMPNQQQNQMELHVNMPTHGSLHDQNHILPLSSIYTSSEDPKHYKSLPETYSKMNNNPILVKKNSLQMTQSFNNESNHDSLPSSDIQSNEHSDEYQSTLMNQPSVLTACSILESSLTSASTNSIVSPPSIKMGHSLSDSTTSSVSDPYLSNQISSTIIHSSHNEDPNLYTHIYQHEHILPLVRSQESTPEISDDISKNQHDILHNNMTNNTSESQCSQQQEQQEQQSETINKQQNQSKTINEQQINTSINMMDSTVDLDSDSNTSISSLSSPSSVDNDTFVNSTQSFLTSKLSPILSSTSYSTLKSPPFYMNIATETLENESLPTSFNSQSMNTISKQVDSIQNVSSQEKPLSSSIISTNKPIPSFPAKPLTNTQIFIQDPDTSETSYQTDTSIQHTN